MRKVLYITLCIALIIGCCSPIPKKGGIRPRPRPKQEVKQLPAPVVPEGVCDTCSLIRLTPKAPEQAVIGYPYESNVLVEAIQNCGNVEITGLLPDGASYIKSEPNGSVSGKTIVWRFPIMDKGERKTLRVWLRPNTQGDKVVCYLALALPRYCVRTKIGKPELTISKDGPKSALLGSEVSYNIVVHNKGTAIAEGVVVEDQIPDGLTHSSGKRVLTFNIGDMAAGSTKRINVRLKAARRGKHCNVATVRSKNAGTLKDQACTDVYKRDLKLAVDCLKQGYVEKRGNAQITIQNAGDSELTKVVVRVTTPSCVKLIDAPGARTAGHIGKNEAAWDVGTLAGGARKTFELQVVGRSEGECCYKVSVTNAQGLNRTATCCTRWIGVPKLQITKDGPATAQVGEEFSYSVVVRNVGTGVAKNVVVTDRIPEGLTHSSGNQYLRFPVGNMRPGDSKRISITRVKGLRTGEFRNMAVATADNTSKVSDDAITVIKSVKADVTVTCPKETYIGKRCMAAAVVKNTGGSPLTNVVVTASWDAKLKVLRLEGNPQTSSTSAVWRIGTLPVGAVKEFKILAISKYAGKQCINVSVTSSEGIREAQSCCTNWKGFPALLLEVIDTVDPVLINEYVDYVIEVTNQGTAEDTQVKVIAIFPNEVTPMTLSGSANGKIIGKKVIFDAYPVITPKQKIKFVIRAKGVNAGDSRLRVEMTSTLLKEPVLETESTQIY